MHSDDDQLLSETDLYSADRPHAFADDDYYFGHGSGVVEGLYCFRRKVCCDDFRKEKFSLQLILSYHCYVAVVSLGLQWAV